MRASISIVAAALPALVAGAHASGSLRARQEPQPGDTLYVNAPACTYYQCKVTYSTGDPVTVNWLNAPKNGNVQVRLYRNSDQSLAYNVTTAPPSIPTNFCDSDQGLGVPVPGRTCGRVEFKMPSFVDSGNYSFAVRSLPPAPQEEEYTDVIIVTKTKDDVPLKLLELKGADGSTYTPTGAGYEGAGATPSPSTPSSAPAPASTNATSGATTSVPPTATTPTASTSTSTTPATTPASTTTTAKPPATGAAWALLIPSGISLAVAISGASVLGASLLGFA